MKILSFLHPYLSRYRGPLLWGLLWLGVTNVLALLIPWMLKEGVGAIEAGQYHALSWAAAVMATAALLRAGTRILSRRFYFHTARHIEVDLRRDLLGRLVHQDAPFFDRHRTGDLLSRFTNDLANIRMLAGFGVLTMINAAMVYLFTLVLLLTLSPSLTLVALLPYPLMLLVVKRVSRRLLHHSTLVQESMGRVSEAVEEGVSGQAVIRASGFEQVRIRHFDKLNDDYLEHNLVLARLRALVLPVMTVVGPVGTLLVFYFGGQRVGAGTLSLGELVAFNAYLMQLAWPTLLLGWVLTLVQRAAASMERLDELLKLPVVSTPETLSLPAPAPAVELRNLNFAYRDKPALQGMSLRVAPGTLVGVTGTTAAGKSTLLALLARLYPVPEGSIYLNGEDLALVDGDSHRRRLAVVPQEGRLFSGSVRDNLLYAVPEGGQPQLEKIAGQVRLEQEVAGFPDGYDTRVGEGGLALSGGQRQRVCLGRALARDGSLWLLDDPFSHLDAATAGFIWQQLRGVLAGKTVFLVSGRVSLLAETDHLLVLDQGKLIQQGSHAELLAEGGLYAKLVERERLQSEMEQMSQG